MNPVDFDTVLEAVTQRAGQVWLRIALAVGIIVAYLPLVDPRFALVWGLAYGAVQAAEMLAFRKDRIRERLSRPGGPALAITLVGLSNLLFAVFAVILALNGGIGLTCSGLLIASVAFNSVLTLHRYPLLMWAGLGPTVLAGLFLPVGSFLFDGSWAHVWYFSTAVFLCIAGLKQALSLATSLKERERDAQRATEQADFAKGRFVANISHELRTPLNGVIASASLLEKSDLGPRDRELVGHMIFASRNLQALIGDILDASKAEAGQLEFAADPFCPSDAIRQAAELHRASAEAKGLAFRVAVQGEPRWARGDTLRVCQVIGNLTNNAIKFTAQGEVALTISTTVEDGILSLSVEVRDSGIGMTPETAADIFKPFVQADVSITREYGGTGLGLSICRILAEGMNAALTVESALGQGSLFRFALKLPVAEPVQDIGSTDHTADAAGSGAPRDRLRILVVDDHPANRRLMELILEGQHNIVSAENGREALDLLTDTPFDLLISDMQMPVMDGPSLLAGLRRLEVERGLPRTPAILATADAAMTLAHACALGADGVVTKPFTAEHLLSVVQPYAVDPSHQPVIVAA